MKIETRAVHAGRNLESGTRDVAPAIHLSTTYERAEDGSFPGGYIYSRYGNPNRTALETCLASLEEGAACIAFASGNAATLAVFQALSPGDHVIVAEDAYFGTLTQLKNVFGPWGLKSSFVDLSDLSALERAMTPATKLIWAETPSNPLLNITDIRAVAGIAKLSNALLVCDNTWATPLFQLPLNMGADVVMHSVTKYLSGHSDVLSGALIFRDTDHFYEKIRGYQRDGGGVPSPFECWLTLRGLQTFPYRVRAQCESAGKIAEYLSNHSRVESVHYPGLAGNPGHQIAARQMTGFGGMLSVQVKGGEKEAFAFAAALRLFTRATSLGGTHSLIEHRASIEGAATRSPANLLRMSVGLEHVDDLIEDLEQALKKIG